MAQFYLGILALSGILMAHQDYLGLEAYITWTRANWIDLPPWVGLGIFFLALFGALRERDRKLIELVKALTENQNKR